MQKATNFCLGDEYFLRRILPAKIFLPSYFLPTNNFYRKIVFWFGIYSQLQLSYNLTMSVCLCVCLCVCLSVCPKTLGQPWEPKNGRIWLKFGTLVPWVNTWGCFFHFFKILIFGPRGPFFGQIWSKPSGQPGEPKNWWIWLKFGTLVPLVNIWGFFFHFFKIFIFGAWGRVFVQNEAKTLGQPREPKNGRIWLKFGTHVPHLFLGWISDSFFHFLKIFIFGPLGPILK